MVSDNTGIEVGYLAGKYPGRIGHLYSPGSSKGPYRFMPYALDNGAFSCWTNETPFDDEAFRKHVHRHRFAKHRPRWIAVPDVVTNAAATIASWLKWEPELRPLGLPLAFVVQDGMHASDVPASAELVFVGGSTEWKWRSLHIWARNFPRVHVGKVNALETLWICHDFSVESCDGTGWFRGDKIQRSKLLAYLEESTSGRKQVVIGDGRGKLFEPTN